VGERVCGGDDEENISWEEKTNQTRQQSKKSERENFFEMMMKLGILLHRILHRNRGEDIECFRDIPSSSRLPRDAAMHSRDLMWSWRVISWSSSDTA